MPATRSEVAEEIKNGKHEGLTTVILDLEDAIGDQQVGQAEESLAQQLLQLLSYVRTGVMSEQQLPLLFVRVRSVEQLERLLNSLGETLALLTGFVLPKFSSDNGRAYFALIAEYNRTMHTGAGDASRTPVLYGLPILESSKIIYRETRWKELLAIKEILDEVQEYVLNVRIGATDFSSLYGLRRSRILRFMKLPSFGIASQILLTCSDAWTRTMSFPVLYGSISLTENVSLNLN